jgi:hypothetical protein
MHPAPEKISSDPDLNFPYPPRRGASRENNGCPRNGVYLQSFKKTELKTYIRNGNILAKYRYPRCERTFSSPLVNDYNQNLAGGWYWQYREDGSQRTKNEFNNEIIFERVRQGSKPLGGLRYWPDETLKSGNLLLHLLASPLAFHCSRNDGSLRINICRKGRLKKIFDFKRLAADYIAMEQAGKCTLLGSSKEIQRFFSSIEDNCLESYLNFDHLRPVSRFDFILTGLILGYPIENTYALLLTMSREN